MGRTVSEIPFAFGLVGGRFEMFAGGKRLSGAERRLGLTDDSTALLVIAEIAAGVLAVVLLTDDDGHDETANPCPPGV